MLKNPNTRGLLMVVSGVLLISFDALLVRLAAVDGWNVAFWRGLFMALAMGAVYFCQRPRDKGLSGAAAPLWFVGLIMACSSLALVLAFTLTVAANAVVVLSLAPLFAALLSLLYIGEPCPLRTWIAILVCIGGVGWVMAGSLGGGNLTGDLLALLATFFIGAYFTLFRRYPNLSRSLTIALGGLFMALMALPFASPLTLPSISYGWLALSGLVQMPLALLLMTAGTRYLPAAEVSLFVLLETVLAPVWVWLALKELPPPSTLYGGGLILLTLVLHALSGLRDD